MPVYADHCPSWEAVSSGTPAVRPRSTSGITLTCLFVLTGCGADLADRASQGSSPSQVPINAVPLTAPPGMPTHAATPNPDYPPPDRVAPPTEDTASIDTFGDSLLLGRPRAVAHFAQGIVVADALISPHLVWLSHETGDILARFGRDGDGPGELRSPTQLRSHPRDSSKIEVFDFRNRRLSTFQMTTGEAPSLVGEVRFTVDVTIDTPVRTEAGYVTVALLDTAALVEFNERGEPLRRITLPRAFGEDVMPLPVGRRLMNRSYIAGRPDGSRYAYFYQFSNLFLILDAALSPVESFRSGRPLDTRFHIENDRFFWDRGNEMGVTHVSATDDRIYTLYCGCRLDTDDATLPTTLRVFDWDGRHRRTLRLPLPTYAIQVDGGDSTATAAVLTGRGEPVLARLSWAPEPDA